MHTQFRAITFEMKRPEAPVQATCLRRNRAQHAQRQQRWRDRKLLPRKRLRTEERVNLNTDLGECIKSRGMREPSKAATSTTESIPLA